MLEVAPQPEPQPIVDARLMMIEEPVMDHGSEDHSEMDHSGRWIQWPINSGTMFDYH